MNVESLRSAAVRRVKAKLVLAHEREASAVAWYQAPSSGFGLDTDSLPELREMASLLCAPVSTPHL